MYANDFGISWERDLDFNKRYLPFWALSQNNFKSPLETKKGKKTACPSNKGKDDGVNWVKLSCSLMSVLWIMRVSLSVSWWNWLVYFCSNIFSYMCWLKVTLHVTQKAANLKCVSWTEISLRYLWLWDVQYRTLWLSMAALALLYHKGCNNALPLKCQEAIK